MSEVFGYAPGNDAAQGEAPGAESEHPGLEATRTILPLSVLGWGLVARGTREGGDRMNHETMKVLGEVSYERTLQDEKWGANRKLDPRTWITIMGEEFGEVCRADLEKDSNNYRKELIQVAAVAVAAVEAFDAE